MTTKPGWYDDPNDATQWRFWDGERWTEDYASAPPVQQTGLPKENDALAIVGYVTAVFLPIIGLVIGLILASKGDKRATPVLVTAALVIGLALFWLYR